ARGAALRAARRGHAPLPPPPSLPREDERGEAERRPAARLGGEPLLLPAQHSAEGRGDPLELPRTRGAAALVAPHHRSRWPRRRARRDRSLAAAGAGVGAQP